MLAVNNIRKVLGAETILNGITFTLNFEERAGLVGPNGAGKTTLLRILAGEDKPDAGSIKFTPAHARVGYLPQGLPFDEDDTLGGFLAARAGNLDTLEQDVARLANAITEQPNNPALLNQYDTALEQLTTASERAGESADILASLGLNEMPADTPIRFLSGGQKTRLALAGVLLSHPQLLLLDEPTNHLDVDMLEWLEQWLNNYRGSALIVSHDRAFLDRTVTRIIELDETTRTVKAYEGNYTDYMTMKIEEREQQRQAYVDQQEEIAELTNAVRHIRGIAKFRKGGKGDTGDKFARGFFANRTKETVARAKAIEKRIEKLMTEDRIDKPRQSWHMKLDFGETPASGQDVLILEDVSVGYDGVPLLAHLNLRIKHGARVALIGPNGTGKTTLVRTIAGRLPPIAGSVRLGSNVRAGYMAQEQEALDSSLDAFGSIRAIASMSDTDTRAFLHQFLFTGDEVFTPVARLSFGERARLMLATLVAKGCNFLLLDEPINHLDIPSRTRFEQALQAFDGTILAVVHDRYFLEAFAQEIWEVRAGTVRAEIV
jgi:ATP-binding cassette subfamily F protein 3